MPTIAVVMPTFNHEEFIEESILSVIHQTHDDWHLYIMDNASTDQTYAIVLPYLNDPRISYHRNEKNIGSFSNIVKGFSQVKEDYAVLLCSDDLFEPNYLQAAQESIAAAPDAAYYAFGWQAYVKDESGRVVKTRSSLPFPPDFKDYVYLAPYFIYGNFIAMISIVFKTQQVLPFLKALERSPIRQIGEIYLMKALEEAYGPGYLNAGNFTCWRRHQGQLTQLHNQNRQYHLECITEPIVYCRLPKARKADWVEINRFSAMMSFLILGAQMNAHTASNWLCSDIGKNLGLTVDFSIEGIEKKAKAVAFAVALTLRIGGNYAQLSREDFLEWFKDLQKTAGFTHLKELFALANQTYDGHLLPQQYSKVIIRESEIRFPVTPESEALSAYYQLLQAHCIEHHEAKALDNYFAQQKHIARFELFLVAQKEQINTLSLSLHALAKLYYDDFSVRIVADFAQPQELQSVARLSWVQLDFMDSVWSVLNQEMLNSSADYAMVLESGDTLLPHALPFLAEYLMQQKNWAAFYVDEDAINEDGDVVSPYFKPDFSPDYFLAHDYVGDGVFFNLEALKNLGGLVLDAPNPIYATLFMLWKKLGQQAIGHVADVLYHRFEKRILKRAGQFQSWLSRQLPSFEIKEGVIPNTFQVLPQTVSEDSILCISVAQNSVERMRHFVEKVVSEWAHVEFAVLVRKNLDEAVLAYLDSIDQNPPNNLVFYLVQDDQTETLLANLLVEHSDAALIFMARPDLIWAEQEGFARCMRYLNMPFVGAVSPRILTPEGKVLGNALILGTYGMATYFAQGARFDEKGHFARQLITQNPCALTFDALLLRKETWLAAGGLDELCATLDNAAAIDFSLRIQKTGQNLAWLPWVSLIALDSERSLLTETQEVRLMQTWLPQLARDHFYNINFSRYQPFHLTEVPQVSKMRLSFKPLPRVMAFYADEMGCGHYRVIEPFNAVQKAGLIDGVLSAQHFTPLDMQVFEADTLFLQRQIADSQLLFLSDYRRYSKMRLVFELDDLMTQVDVTNDHYLHLPKDITKRLEKALSYCDRFVVSTEPLKEVYSRYIDDIRVVPNRIDIEKWGKLKPLRRAGKKPRVGWSGGISHRGDLQIIVEVVKRLADEVEWVFFGMCPEEIRSVVEWHNGVPTPEYPRYLAALNLDLAIAPLAHSAFNECKSHLKLLEYGILGYPVVASNFGPYARSGFPVTLVENRPKDWINAIREHVNDLDALAENANQLREWVKKDWILQDHVEEWRSAWCDF